MTKIPVNLSRWDKIIVDTCSLMESDAGWDTFAAQMKGTATKVIIPSAVEREIRKLLSSKNVEKRAKAGRAHCVVSKLISDDVGEIVALNAGRGSQDNIADEEIVSHVVLLRRKHNFLVLTEDRRLATRLLGGDVAKTRRYLDVALVKSDGGLELWEAVQCDDCRMFTAARKTERARQKILCWDCIQKSADDNKKPATDSRTTTYPDKSTSFSATENKASTDPKATESDKTSASIPNEPSSSGLMTVSKTFGPDGRMIAGSVRSAPGYFKKLAYARKTEMASRNVFSRALKAGRSAWTVGAIAVTVSIAVIKIIDEIRQA
jgi:rRNA-processing protein FCF1